MKKRRNETCQRCQGKIDLGIVSIENRSRERFFCDDCIKKIFKIGKKYD